MFVNPLRSEWLHKAVDIVQSSLGADPPDPQSLVSIIGDLVKHVPPPVTMLEVMLFRGLVAEIMIRHLVHDGLVAETCAKLLAEIVPAPPERGSLVTHPKVLLALTLIATSFHRSDLHLRDVAKAVQLTPWHLSRLLHREVGCGFASYLRTVRLDHSAVLLKSPQKSVKEVCAAVGYKYGSDFATQFKNRFGMSPNTWRRQTPRLVPDRSSPA